MNTQKRTLTLILLAGFLTMCGSPGADMLGDAMVDVGDALRDGAMPDAAAQTDCGTCAAGALRTLTADTDAARLESGVTALNATGVEGYAEITAGPFVLTDAYVTGGETPDVFVSDGTCDDLTANRYMLGPIGGRVSGLRLVVPAGRRLCLVDALTNLSVYWSGFHPYE